MSDTQRPDADGHGYRDADGGNDRNRNAGVPPRRALTRRDLLKGGLAALGAAGAATVAGAGLSKSAGASIERALALSPGTLPSLSDIQHVVILMQENRSFDHYYGRLSGVRGFSDPNVLSSPIPVPGKTKSRPVWRQFGYQPGAGVDPNGFLEPFHLIQNPPTEDGATTNDISHEWTTQHDAWNGGAMNNFVNAHLAADGESNFAVTMGYFQRSDLAFYYALADAFTICDGYHCSVLGPTDPNRVMAFSASIDPAGTGGGPILVTQTSGRPQQYNTLTWTTMPEQLLDAGVSWKVYNDPTGLALFSPLPYFKAYNDPTTTRGQQLQAQALTPAFPADFVADVAAGTLPQVSWIHGPVVQCEHPATAPQWGENLVQTVLDTLTSNPDVWAQTLFILHYDENGGFFDHVPPPVPPAGTAGEYLTVDPLPSTAGGIVGPVGLGFRVPCLLLSPFSQGGYVSHHPFDHTSTLRLLETLFGAPVPNLTAWRRSVTGDMTQALALGQPANTTVPTLPNAPLVEPTIDEQIIVNALTGTFDEGFTYTPPTVNAMPVQESHPTRPTPPR